MYKILTIGCTGKVTGLFTDGFLDLNVHVKVLSRNSQKISDHFPKAQPVVGSMYNPNDVAQAMKDVDAAFFCSPMGVQNNISSEVAAAKAVIRGAERANLKHLIYVSVMKVDHPESVGIYHAKYEIEKLLEESSIPWTAIRCGSYMEDVFDPRLDSIKKGIFLFPIAKKRRFTYTSQSDVPRFVVEELLKSDTVLNNGFNFTDSQSYSIYEVEKILSDTFERKVRGIGTFPMYYVLWLLFPYFYFTKHRFSSVIPLLSNFNKYGYVSKGDTTVNLFPNFKLTSLENYLNMKSQ